MKMSRVYKILCIIISFSLCAAHILAPSAAAQGDIYVNGDSETLGTDINSANVIGAGGSVSTVTDGTVYAMTGNGIAEVGSGGSGNTIVNPEDYIDDYAVGSSYVNITSRTTIRVGIQYYYSASRDTSVDSARLTNYIGSGFAFGYYDANYNFIEVGRTTETAIGLVRDTNVSLSAGTLGCFHILLPGSYSTYAAAAAAAAVYSDGFVGCYSGGYYALAGHYTSSANASSAMASRGISGTAYSASNRCIVVTKAGTTQILFEFDCGTDTYFTIRPLAATGAKAVTTLGSYRYYGDFQAFRLNGENMTISNVLPLEDYVKGVVPYEMSSTWPLEALKAQACCARTYVMRSLNSYSKYGFDVTCDTYCQAYYGTNRASELTDRAVDETKGLYVTYKGALCDTVYSSSMGGATESAINVWANDLPYLIGKYDPFEAASDDINGYSSWTYSYTGAQLASKLQSAGYNVTTIISVTPSLSDTGNVVSLALKDANGKEVTLKKNSCRTSLGLPSIHYSVTYDSKGGKFVFTGAGWGHQVGMSQFGAYAMAKYYDLSYTAILRFYYTNVDISIGVYS